MENENLEDTGEKLKRKQCLLYDAEADKLTHSYKVCKEGLLGPLCKKYFWRLRPHKAEWRPLVSCKDKTYMRCLRNNPEVPHVSLEVKGPCGAWTTKERELGEYAYLLWHPVLGTRSSWRCKERWCAAGDTQVKSDVWKLVSAGIPFL